MLRDEHHGVPYAEPRQYPAVRHAPPLLLSPTWRRPKPAYDARVALAFLAQFLVSQALPWRVCRDFERSPDSDHPLVSKFWAAGASREQVQRERDAMPVGKRVGEAGNSRRESDY